MKMQQLLKVWTMAAVMALLTACAQVGMAPAQSFSEKLAYSYSQVTALRVSAAQALQSGAITAADGQQVLQVTDGARTGLDAAKATAASGDLATAEGKLQAVTAGLVSVQQYLLAKGVK